MFLKIAIVLFLLFSMGALFYGLYYLVTSNHSTVQLFQSLKYRVIFAAICLSLIGLQLFLSLNQSA